MENKYKALSYIPPKPINIKQRFGKLTLATCTSAEKTKQTRLTTPPTSSKKTCLYINPNNNDVRISDDSIITDDESDNDNDPSGSERNKIINNILNSDDKSNDDNDCGIPMNVEPIRQINRNNYDDDPSQFSEKLLLDDSGETNCNEILETEMGKLDIKLNPATPRQKKSSTPLFSTMSDTIVSRLSSQMDRLGLIDGKNLPDEIKIRNSLIERDLLAMKPEPPAYFNSDTSSTNVSILTISSTESDDSETEKYTDEDEEDAESAIIILSSDEDVCNERRGSSELEIEKHVSNLSNTTSDTLNTQVKKKLSDFFNNIPSPETPKRISSANECQETVPETPEEYEYIPETPENLSLNDNPNLESAPVINTESSVAKINSQVAADPNLSNDADDTHVSINISTKIQINIQISELEKTRCDSTEPSEPEREPEEPPECDSEEVECELEESQLENKTNSLKEDEIGNQISPEQQPTPYKFVGLNQTDVEIDEEMECILNELYGKTWQTPQLLQKCLSTKKKADKPMPKQVIDDTDFSLFGKKINDELESTRLPEQIMSKTKPVDKPKATTTKKKMANTKKCIGKKLEDSSSDEETEHHLQCRRLDFGHVGRPKRQAAVKSQQLLKVCDPDTSDSEINSSCENGSDSDLDFTINKKDMKDYSDNEQEKENRSGDRCIEKILGRYEYIKKPTIQNTPPLSYELPATTKAGNSKRKLYTPQNYEIPLLEEQETPPSKPNRSSEESLKQISNWLILQNKKIDEVKKCDLFVTPKPATKAKKEVVTKSSVKSGTVPKGGRTYGFIQSLDEKIPKEYCHPDAIKYIDSYVKNKVELADKLYEIYDKIFNFPQKIDVRWNKKLLTTAGRCLTKRKNGERTCHVELSEKVLTTADRLRCTLIHELCHAANWIYDGLNGHGIQWKAWASKARKMFPELPKINVCHAYDIEYKYTYMCIQCNVKQQAHSKSIKVDTKRCKFCYGKIQVFLNKKNRDGDVVYTPIREVKGFAKFVQDNYKLHKKDELKHADVMKMLSTKFKELDVDKV